VLGRRSDGIALGADKVRMGSFQIDLYFVLSDVDVA
jgi:hypothetical protein